MNVLFWGNIDVGTKVIDRHPDTRFVIDHLGMLQPRTPETRASEPWEDLPKVVALATRKNAVIKVSGVCTFSKEEYPYADIWDPPAKYSTRGGLSAAYGAQTGRAPIPSSTTNTRSSPFATPTG